MSTLDVKVVQVDDVRTHSNADRLELVTIKGWQVVVQKDKWRPGDLGVYFPPDTLLPTKWTNEFGVTKYCQPQPDDMQRIRCARLRGEPSFGLLIPALSVPGWVGLPEGTDVADLYDAQKYEPPIKFSAGDAESDHPGFFQFTEIENLRNNPEIFLDGEEVYVTEKLHGTNCRIAIVESTTMAGSHRVRRRLPETADGFETNRYWFPYTIEGVRNLLQDLSDQYKSAILYGEVYGRGIQAFQYGQKGIAFAAFDLCLDGQYCSVDEFRGHMSSYGIPQVPERYRGPYSLAAIQAVSKGQAFQGDHIREGVVVRPVQERSHPKVGRVILKYVSDEYLLGLKEDFTDL